MTTIHGAVIYAVELDRLTAFYSRLGLTVEEGEPGDYAVLAAGGSELSIVQIPAHIVEDIDLADPPPVRSHTPIKLAFVVPSIDEALEVATTLGGRVGPDSSRWQFRGHLIQDAIDPEGNVYQLREARSEIERG